MTDLTPQPVTIDHLMAATNLGPIQVRKLVRLGQLPGQMLGRTYWCSPGEYQRWLAGDWTPRPQPQPVTLLHKRAS